MSRAKFNGDFKRDAVHQIVDRNYPVAQVSRRLDVSTYTLYGWVRLFPK